MIQYNPRTWFRHIFLFHKSDTLRILWPEIIIIGFYTWGLTYLALHFFSPPTIAYFKNAVSIHSLLGFVIGLLLVFRTNTAYERWWEGRKLWGQLVNSSRNLALKFDALLPLKSSHRKKILLLITTYPFVLKEHLRDKNTSAERLSLSGSEKDFYNSCQHKPNAVADIFYKEVKQLYTEKIISGEEFLILDKQLESLTDITGACERIKNTPIPFSYNLFIKKFIFFYVITLPIGLIPDFHYWNIPISIFVFYVLVSLELLAEKIEDPFGNDNNDLPTDELVGKIHKNTIEIFSEKMGEKITPL